MIPNAAEWQLTISYNGKQFSQRFRRSNINSPCVVKMISKLVGCGAADIDLRDKGSFVVNKVHPGAWAITISKTK